MTDFRDDTDPIGGSSSGSYLNKPIILENPATSLDVRVGASVSSSSIKAFLEYQVVKKVEEFKILNLLHSTQLVCLM